MSEDLEQLEAEEPEAPASTDPFAPQKRELLGEIKKWKVRAREAEKKYLATRLPSGIDPELFDGIPVDKVEALLAALPTGTTVEAPAEAAPVLTDEQQAALQTLGSKAAAPPVPKRYSFAEAKEMGGIGNPEVRKLVEQGLVDLP